MLPSPHLSSNQQTQEGKAVFESRGLGLKGSFSLFLLVQVYRVSSICVKSPSWLKIVDGAQSAVFNAFLLRALHRPLPEEH